MLYTLEALRHNNMTGPLWMNQKGNRTATKNFSKKYQQFFLLDTIFLEQNGPFKP